MGLFSKIFGKPRRRQTPRSTKRERELDDDIRDQLQRRTPFHGQNSMLTVGDKVSWNNLAKGKGGGTVVKIVRDHGLGAKTTITVLDDQNNSLLHFFTGRPDHPVNLHQTGSHVTLATVIIKHRRKVAADLGTSVQDPRVANLGEDWGDYTSF